MRGQGTIRLGFGDLDQRYTLKMRAFIEIVMGPVFRDLEKQFNLFALRQDGIVPIMFYLDFSSGGQPLAFGRELITEHEIGIYSHSGAPRGGAGAAPRERLLLDSRSVFKAHLGTGDAASLGYDREKGALEAVGSAQVLQVFTRPLAAPEARDVAHLPPEFGEVEVAPWLDPFPVPAMLEAAPEGFREAEPAPWQTFSSVWGLPNTDVNQHVNVQEYIVHMENQFTRLVHCAGLPAGEHRVTRARLLFRKPFFAGQPYGVRGRLWVRERETVLLGGLYGLGADGELEPRPNVLARYEGILPPG